MEQPQRHPMEELLLFTARELSKQYGAGQTREQFDALIAAAEGKETDAGEQSEEHEQGRPTPPLEPAPSLQTTDAEHEQGKLPPTP